ncbi:MAG: hypothetical protein HOV80_09900 [Polyangiaceae bacterium]|nr:hypothetical protein [Polyangiaceae bacterium]
MFGRAWWVALVGLSGCQLVLGFEDHEPFPGGGGGAGAGASTSTQNTTSTQGTTTSTQSSTTGGEGGQPIVYTFGEATELVDAGTELTDLVVEGDRLYALSPSDQNIVSIDLGASKPKVETLGMGLNAPRGLVYSAGALFTTAGDMTALSCSLYQVDPISGAPTSLIGLPNDGTNCYFALGAEGTLAAASRGDEVRTRTGGGQGQLIGKAYAGSTIPALVIDSGKYFWIDVNSGELLRSDGATVQPQHNPPGNQVDTLAQMAVPADLAVRNGQVYVVGDGGVGRVAATANNSSFTILTPSADAPRGISVDASHVYWADGTSLRAVLLDAQGVTPTVLYDDDETPNDSVSVGETIYFTTQSGKIFTISKTVE